jgi:hypothetical protein
MSSKRYPARRLVARWQAEAAEANPLDPGAYVVEQHRLWHETRRKRAREYAARRDGRIPKL